MSLSLREFLSGFGLLKKVDPIVNDAYKKVERDIWEQDLESSPHGNHWHTSFHASQFPGDNPYACGRQAMYVMMNLPQSGPVDRKLRMIADVGKDIELQIVKRIGAIGILLSANVNEAVQTGFVDTEHWLTGSTDLVINLNGRPHPVEIKTKSQSVIDEMRTLKRGPDEKHIRQLKTTIALARESQHILWPDLEPITDGTLYYVARDSDYIGSVKTHEFNYEYDPKFMEAGRAYLKQWRKHFETGTLPERPSNWLWSKEPYPCKYCPFKREACKKDDIDNIIRLEDSHGIKWAKSVRPNYNYETIRQAVLDRWNNET